MRWRRRGCRVKERRHCQAEAGLDEARLRQIQASDARAAASRSTRCTSTLHPTGRQVAAVRCAVMATKSIKRQCVAFKVGLLPALRVSRGPVPGCPVVVFDVDRLLDQLGRFACERPSGLLRLLERLHRVRALPSERLLGPAHAGRSSAARRSHPQRSTGWSARHRGRNHAVGRGSMPPRLT